MDKLKMEGVIEKTEEIKKTEDEMENTEEKRRKRTEECLEAYQISLTYANTPGR